MTRVSVVIPCFNHGQFLAEAVESVLAQTRQPDELIIVDDGSTDSTAEVAAQFASVRYIYQENAGLAAARNSGLRHARANYVLFLDADDLLLPTAIEHCLTAFSTQTDSAFVYGGYQVFDCRRVIIFKSSPRSFADPFGALLRKNHIGMNGTVMFDAAILKRAGGFDDTLRSCEDYEIYLRLAKAHPIGMYPQIAAEYRRHQDNMSRDAAMMLKDARSVLARHAYIARTSPAWRRAYTEGARFLGNYYGAQLADMLVAEWSGPRRVSKLALFLATGLRYDRRFALRLARRFARASRMRFQRLRTPARVY